MIDRFRDEGDKKYSGGFDFYSQWLFQYFHDLTLYEDIESVYHTRKSEHHILTRKCDSLRSFLLPVKHYHVTHEDDDKPFKINYHRCNLFVR